ncbi:MAG TPA: calcineurin-like phosphoesterase C-terminal domain-containing protein, partial [Sphingobacteriaceae bacterium]
YSFNYNKVHFIILDNVLYPDPRYGKGYRGGMRTEQLDFIENDLKLVPKDHLIVLSHHIHLFDDDFRSADKQRLFDLLREFPHTLSLSAHTHMQQQYFHDQKDGLNRTTPHHEYNVGTTSGDWYTGEPNDAGIPSGQMRDGTPKGYMFVSFSGNKYQMDYRVAGAHADYKINIYAPRAIPKGRLPWNYLYANFFQGSSRDTLEYRIDDGAWKRMKWTLDIDPIMCGIRYRWDTAEKPLKGVKPTSPAMSPHLWKVALSGNVDEGRHIIEVRAKDTLGRVYTNSTSFMVTETDIR